MFAVTDHFGDQGDEVGVTNRTSVKGTPATTQGMRRIGAKPTCRKSWTRSQRIVLPELFGLPFLFTTLHLHPATHSGGALPFHPCLRLWSQNRDIFKESTKCQRRKKLHHMEEGRQNSVCSGRSFAFLPVEFGIFPRMVTKWQRISVSLAFRQSAMLRPLRPELRLKTTQVTTTEWSCLFQKGC